MVALLIRAVAIDELAEIWPKVRDPLDRLYRKVKSDGWIPEDVYALCASNAATLYVNEGVWIGFMVLQIIPRYTKRSLHVWLLHVERAPEEFMGELRELAKAHGCEKITFRSPRRGWERRAQDLGFKAVSTNYEQGV